METEFIIAELTKHNGWCCCALAGKTRERAEKVLQEVQKKHPEKQLRIEEVESASCWWREEDKWRYH